MATTTIPWEDGSGDNIYLTYSSASGDQTVEVSSDANTGNARSKIVTFTSGVGNITQQLTVNQEAGREPIPGEDGYTWCYYDVTSTSSATTLLYNTTGITKMIVDGEEKTIATSYTFPTTGIHLVKFKDRSTSNSSRFRGCTRLIECYLQDGLTTIPYRMFRECTNLKKVQSFTSLTTAGSNAQYFYGCSAIETIILPGLQSVGAGFGGGGNLQTVELEGMVTCGPTSANASTFEYGVHFVIGPNCTMIGARCFYNNTYLRVLVVKAVTPPTLYSNSFYGTSSSLKIYVPYSSDHSILNAYKEASNWSTHSSKIYELNADGNIPE